MSNLSILFCLCLVYSVMPSSTYARLGHSLKEAEKEYRGEIPDDIRKLRNANGEITHRWKGKSNGNYVECGFADGKCVKVVYANQNGFSVSFLNALLTINLGKIFTEPVIGKEWASRDEKLLAIRRSPTVIEFFDMNYFKK